MILAALAFGKRTHVGFSSLLVDRNVVYLDPGMVVVGSICDGISAGARVPGVAISRAGPVATDGNIEGEGVITEGVGDITTLVGPISDRNSPVLRVRVSVLDILGDLVTLEPPERDLSLVPEHNDDTTVLLVERTASASLEIVDGTTGIMTVRALTHNTKGVSKVTLWLRTVSILVPRGNVGVQFAFDAGAAV